MADKPGGKRPASGDKFVDVLSSRTKKTRMRDDDDDSKAVSKDKEPDATPKTPMQKLHEKAVRNLDAGRTAEAYRLFKAALVYCTCQRTVRRQFQEAGVPLEAIDPLGNCSCKDFVAAAQKMLPAPSSPAAAPSYGLAALAPPFSGPFSINNVDMDAVYNLSSAVTPCKCGSGRTQCRALGHLLALDRLAVAAARLEQTAEATAAAQWYLDVAPEQAQGYLHMAKAVLLGGPGSPDDPIARRFAVRCLYKHGMHNMRTHGDGTPETNHMAALLERCYSEYGAGDYLPMLPVETAEMVFQHLSLGDLVRCCRVSRSWAAMLKRLQLRVSLVRLAGARGFHHGGGTNGAGSLVSLRRLFKRLPGLQTPALYLGYGRAVGRMSPVVGTAIYDPRRTLDQAPFIFQALELFRGIETLAVHAYELLLEPASFEEEEEPGTPQRPLWPPGVLDRCRHLVLEGMLQENQAPLLGLVRSASASLEFLELQADTPPEVGDLLDNVSFPKLKILRTDGLTWANGSLLVKICVAAPNLEQLYLDDVDLDEMDLNDEDWESDSDTDVAPTGQMFTDPPNYDPYTVLGNLHTFVLGPQLFRDDPMPEILPEWFPVLPEGMRCIDILCEDATLACLFLMRRGVAASEPSPFRSFPRIEYFRCLADMGDIRPDICMLDVVRPSLDPVDGRLAHLELCGRYLERSYRNSPRFAIPAPTRMRTIGLHDVDWDQEYRDLPGHLVGRTYVDWLAQFTQAEIITVSPEYDPRDSEALLLALVERRLAAFRVDADEDSSDRPPPLTICHTVRRPGLKTKLANLIGDHPIKVEVVDIYKPPVFPWPDAVAEEAAA